MISINLIKQFVLSVLSLVFIALIFGTVTYAWVSMARINNVDGISLTASVGDELQISYDDINYSTSLSLLTHLDRMQLKDVTSLDGMTFHRGPHQTEGEAVKYRDYISFDLFFRTTRKESGIYLTNRLDDQQESDLLGRGTSVTSKGVSFFPKVNYTEDNHVLILAGSMQTYYAKDAVRMSFTEIDDHDLPIQTLIYDPSGNEARGYGKYYGAHSYFINRTMSPLRIPEEKPVTIYRLSQMDPMNPYQALDNTSLIARMKEGHTIDDGITHFKSKVRVSIWIEGWDADAIDGILLDQIRVQLEFKLAHLA